jgi:hypothetical protein
VGIFQIALFQEIIFNLIICPKDVGNLMFRSDWSKMGKDCKNMPNIDSIERNLSFWVFLSNIP